MIVRTNKLNLEKDKFNIVLDGYGSDEVSSTRLRMLTEI